MRTDLVLSRALLATVAALFVACQAPARSAHTALLNSELTDARVGSSDRVTAEELAPLGVLTLDEAIKRLRPQFLLARFANASSRTMVQPTVYIDDHYAGAVEMLQTVPVSTVVEIVYLRAATAYDRYGLFCRCDAGVILVTTHRAR